MNTPNTPDDYKNSQKVVRLLDSLQHSKQESYYYQDEYRKLKYKYSNLRTWFVLNSFILMIFIIKEFLV